MNTCSLKSPFLCIKGASGEFKNWNCLQDFKCIIGLVSAKVTQFTYAVYNFRVAEDFEKGMMPWWQMKAI